MGSTPDTRDDDERDEDGEPVVLDPRIQEAIGRSLKTHYDELVKEPIPDRLLVLLAQLEAKERGHEQ
jgi:hypothetical protein